ncbi:MAG: phosphohydrolase [Methylotenera sp.]|nr:MAG: phosphohydrolase [Methylotenera sp.]
MSKPLCIYHAKCADGFTAAWVVKLALGDVEFYPGVHQSPPPDVTDRDVIIVDFSYKRPVIEEMLKTAKSILILDHHKSAMEDLGILLAPNLEINFDMEHSGAMMTWMHYFPNRASPMLIQMVEDRDLWKFTLEGTREVAAAIFAHEYTFENWDMLMNADISDLITAGKAIEKKHFKDIHELLTITQRRLIIHGVNVPAANLPYTMSSDAGHIMAKGEAFAACYYDGPDGRNFSLRSNDDGMDVSAIAKMYGGGGHRNAAGFKVSYSVAESFEVQL